MDIFKNTYSLNEWENSKREEILNLFLKEEYGFRSKALLSIVPTYQIIENKVIDSIRIYKVNMKIKELDVPLYIYMPNDSNKHKVFVEVMHQYAEEQADKDLVNKFDTFTYCPIREVVNKGFIVCLVPTRNIVEDEKRNPNKVYKDIYSVTGDNPDDVGAIQMWSYGVSKAIDYLLTLDNVDKNYICVIGHSRGGKTALLTGVQDARVKLTVSSCSGNSGAAISRNNDGETIEKIIDVFPYWFNKNYQKYVNKEESLPFDQHMLLGLIAPRNLYVFSASNDSWACPKNELLSAKLASQYYTMYNIEGLIVPEEVKNDVSYNKGNIAYHIKTGNHCIESRDWNMVINYFNKL